MGKIRKTETRGTEYERFGANLASARISAGLSQSEMAERMEIPQSTYCGYETGRRSLDIDTIAKLSKFYNLSIEKFVGKILPDYVYDDMYYEHNSIYIL